MKTKLPWILCALLAIALAVVALPKRSTQQPAPSTPRKVLYYVDPMHPSYKSSKPGTAPDCGMELVPVYEGDAPAGTSNVKGYAPVALTPERRQLIGVQTALAEKRSVGRTIRTVGRVAVDETRLHTVTTKFEGYIDRLYADFTGKPVRAGQPLFSIYSPDLLASQQEYLLARRAAMQSPELLEASRQRLRLWDVSDAEIRALERSGTARKNVTISAPVSGYILKKEAVAGARVMPGMPMFEIANLDRVWVLADVYEADLQTVRTGQTATITMSYLPGRTFTGRVTFIDPIVDPMTRTIKVRVEVDNRDGALKPEMFADVVLQETPREAVTVPDSAVLATGERSLVFVVKDGGTFDPREVETGVRTNGAIEIRRGLAAGEKVATQANFLIDSESRLKAALQ